MKYFSLILTTILICLTVAPYASATEDLEYKDLFTEQKPTVNSKIMTHPRQSQKGAKYMTDTVWIMKNSEKQKAENEKDILLDVELALNNAQQARGLMFRTYMPSDHGMLFVFNDEDKRTFWMKNTLIPLDLLFIARDGEIHHIHHNAKPQDLTRITSERDSYAVLEINGGMADKLGIVEGDYVIHSSFRNTNYR